MADIVTFTDETRGKVRAVLYEYGVCGSGPDDIIGELERRGILFCERVSTAVKDEPARPQALEDFIRAREIAHGLRPRQQAYDVRSKELGYQA